MGEDRYIEIELNEQELSNGKGSEEEELAFESAMNEERKDDENE